MPLFDMNFIVKASVCRADIKVTITAPLDSLGYLVLAEDGAVNNVSSKCPSLASII